MDKVRKKIVLYAMTSIFVLLTVILAIINGVNFTMAADDADMITQVIADRHGAFEGGGTGTGDNKNKTQYRMQTEDIPQKGNELEKNADAAKKGQLPKGMGPMGPDSPETNKSVRYFTYVFDDEGKAKTVVHNITAVDEEEAALWAESLIRETTGWTKGTYRYRVYSFKDKTYVTVIDQGRELLPSYRILIISVCGELLGLLASFIVLESISKKLVRPLEDADRKQRQFISNVEKEFKLPLTVINANTEIIEKESGCTDYTRSINRQVRRMTSLVKDLRALSVINDDSDNITEIDFSEIMTAVLDGSREKFKERNIKLSMDIEENIKVNGDEERVRRVIRELSDNSLLFGKTEARFTLTRDSERITLNQYNDTQLPEGTVDQVFDRFITLENADNYDTAGLGLSYVKDTVKSMGGRLSAKVSDGVFMLTIAL